MPMSEVEALEKFIIRTTYLVEADYPEQAKQLCKSGNVAYNRKSAEEGNEEWIETVSVEIVSESE